MYKMKLYNFDEIIERRGTSCVKYDGLQENFGIFDGAVYMALCCKVNYDIGMLFLKDRKDPLAIADVFLVEHEIRVLHRVIERVNICRISKRIHAYDLPLGTLLQQHVDKVRTNKSGTAGDENCFFHNTHPFLKIQYNSDDLY